MGEPAEPPPAARAESRRLSAAVLEAVRADGPWPEPFTSVFDDERDAVFALCQEVELLQQDAREQYARTSAAFQWIDYWGGNEQSRADAGDIEVGNYTVDAEYNLIDRNGKRVPR